jgi:hypothetical protein
MRGANAPQREIEAMRTFLILTLASIGAAAVVSAADDARATYERERAACLSGHTGQDRSTCLREADAAYREARNARRGPTLPQDRYADNALLRCRPLSPPDRAECERRMRSGSSSGSVTGGGILRELRTVQDAPATPKDAEHQPTPSPMPAPSPAPARDAEHRPTPSSMPAPAPAPARDAEHQPTPAAPGAASAPQ